MEKPYKPFSGYVMLLLLLLIFGVFIYSAIFQQFIVMGIAFPVFILVIFNEPEDLYRVFAIAVALMVLITHQKNIGRLLQGNESKVPILKHRDRRRLRRRANRNKL